MEAVAETFDEIALYFILLGKNIGCSTSIIMYDCMITDHQTPNLIQPRGSYVKSLTELLTSLFPEGLLLIINNHPI